MDKLVEAFKNLPTGIFPEGLHASVMRTALVSRYRKLLLATFVVLCWNFGMAAWGTWDRMEQLGSIDALRTIFDGFAWNVTSFSDAADVITDFLPLRSLVLGAVNLLSIVYFIHLFRQSRIRSQQTLI